jgi:hypothetical protein
VLATTAGTISSGVEKGHIMGSSVTDTDVT